MKKYNFKLKSFIIFLITSILLWYILKDSFNSSINILLSSNLLFVLLAIIVYFIYYFIEAYILKILINKYSNYSMKQSLKLSIMTKFFNGVTPFSLGGQPLQVYELSKDNVSLSSSALIIVENFIIFQITICFMTIISFIANIYFNIMPSSILWNATVFGFIINIVILIITLLICLNMIVAIKTGNLIIKILYKIHIIKDLNKSKESWQNICHDYEKGFREITHNKKTMFKCIILDILCMTIYFLIPIFILKAININIDSNIFITLIIGVFIYMVGSYIPLPGGSIGIEYAFINYFGIYFNNSYLTPAVILWRSISYYLPMIIGAIFYNLKQKGD